MSNAATKRTRRRLVELACICFAVAMLGWFVFPELTTLTKAEVNVRDLVAATSGRPDVGNDFVFVAIDEPSMQLDQLWPEDIEASPELTAMAEGWPWPRSAYAGAIEKILKAGARLVLLDLVLPDERPGDEALRRVLDTYPDRVVIGAAFNNETVNPDHPELISPALQYPAASLIPSPEGDRRVGYVNFWPDPLDRAVRTAVYRLDVQGKPYSSMAGRALELLGESEKLPPPNRPRATRMVDFSSVRVVPFYTLFLATDWQRTLKNGAVFKDKIVVIGPSAPILHDIHLLPLSESVPGPLIHVNAIAAALGDFFFSRPGVIARNVSVGIAALFALLVSASFVRRPLIALGALLGLAAVCLVTAFLVFRIWNYALPVIQPGSVLLSAGVLCIAWNFAQERRESGRMRSMLERYVSRNVVREVLDNREDFLSALGGTRRPMTVFFSDVRGFTSFSEQADATAVVEQINEYLGEMVAVIFRNQGTVDKFMGDGIMAVWGNVVSDGEAADACRAVQASLEMQARIAALNERWVARGIQPFTVGMGLHHGEAVFGNIGSDEKMEPTVIGDTVNLASRVEGLTKKYGVPICLTQPLAELAGGRFRLRAVDLVQVVGKKRPVEIFTVLGLRDMPVPGWLGRYEDAVADFRARRFAEAAEALRTCLADAPDDRLCAIYLDRAERFLAEPPPEGWNGTEIATSK